MIEQDPLNALENALRDLIEPILRTTYGDGWFESLGVTKERVETWEARRDEEPKRRPGGQVEQRLLYYAEFFDLIAIVQKNWDSGFKGCFGDRKRFDVYMDRLSAYRNPDAHSRALLPFEQHLLLGMTGELRQEITVFVSAGGAGPEPEHFARIEEVRDSFGLRVAGDAMPTTSTSPRSKAVLRPGDTVSFSARSWDPEGAPVRWRIFVATRGSFVDLNGSELSWDWEVEDRDISETSYITFELISSRGYHRSHRGYDDVVTLYYTVLPRGR